jgi:hypothetical protein
VSDPIEPLKVHIASTDVHPTPTPVKRCRYATECRTVVLTADNNPVRLLEQDINRVEFWLQPLDFDVVLCHSKAQVQGTGNTPSATQATPDGAYIPKTNLQAAGPFQGTDEMWVVSAGNANPLPNRVALIITREASA